MKVLLINPPQSYPSAYYSISSLRVQVPIGLLQIAAAVEEKGYEARIIDAFTLSKKIIHQGRGTIHFGASWESISEEIRRYSPDAIGITSPFTSQLNNARKAVEIAALIYPDIPIIVGGPHASIRPEDFLKKADIAVIGEGDMTLIDILDSIREGRGYEKIRGIAYKKNERIVVTKPRLPLVELDMLPFPAYHLIDLEKYFELFKGGMQGRRYITSERVIPMITSRGCPFNCCFCSIHLHMGRRWRSHSADYVLRHIKHVVENYKVKHISFEDDNLTFDNVRFEAILEGIIQNSFGITWDTPNGVRADTLNENLIRKSKKAGLTRFVIGVESGDQEVLSKIVDKALDLKKVTEVASICKKVGVDLHAFFVIGFPGETRKNIRNTLNYAFMLNKKYNVIPAFATATPLLGTRLYKTCEEQGCFVREITPENIMIGSPVKGEGLIRTKDFTPEYLSKTIKSFYTRIAMQQLLKPGYLVKRFAKDPNTFFKKAKSLIHYAFASKIK